MKPALGRYAFIQARTSSTNRLAPLLGRPLTERGLRPPLLSIERESHISPRSWATSARWDIGRCSSWRVHGVSQNSTFTRVTPSGSAESWLGKRNSVNRPLNMAHSRLERMWIVPLALALCRGAGLVDWLMAVRLDHVTVARCPLERRGLAGSSYCQPCHVHARMMPALLRRGRA